MSLEKLEILDIPEMWIENGYRFLKEDEPYGLENGENFTLYMPETPIEQLSEDFLIWWAVMVLFGGGDCQTRETFLLWNVQ